MAVIPTTALNQYKATDSLGATALIVAEDMATACQVYNQEHDDADPVIMHCINQGISCANPTVYVTFKTLVAETAADGTAYAGDCRAAPHAYTVKAGTSQIFTAMPGAGWEFDHWEMVGYEDAIDEDEATKPIALLTIPSVSEPLIIKAVFKTTV